MKGKAKRLLAIVLAVLMMSLPSLTSFAQTGDQLFNDDLPVEAFIDEAAVENEVEEIVEKTLIEEVDAEESEIISGEEIETEEPQDISGEEIETEEPQEIPEEGTATDESALTEEVPDESLLGAVDITQYGKKGGYLCIADSIGRGMGTSGDYKNNKPMEIPDVTGAISGSNTDFGIFGGLVNMLANSMIPSIIRDMNLPASLDFTKKYVSGSYPAEVAKAIGCDNGRVANNGWNNKNTNYWPLCYVGETSYGVNDLLNYDDGYTDNAFTHGCCDIYSMFMYPIFGTNKSYSKGVKSDVLSNYLKSNYRQNSGYETKASLISIELGLNDVIVKAMTDSKICTNPMQKFLDINDFKKNQNKYENMLPAYSKALIDNEKTWEKSYEALLSNLKKNNPNADYVLIGLYDPFEGVGVPAGFEILNTDTAEIVGVMNEFVKKMAAKYVCMYVDISDTETLIDARGYDLVTAGEKTDCTIEFGFHPSQNGHKQITDKVIAAIKSGEIETGSGEDVTIGDVSYKVEHYQETLDGKYELKETDNLTTASNKLTITPSVKTYTGFAAPNKKEVTVNKDGSTVIRYEYTRNSYQVNVNKGTGIASVSGAGTYKYGATVSLSATASEGYEDVKWSGDVSTSSFTMPAKNVTVTASATRQQQPQPQTDNFTVTIVVNDPEYGRVSTSSVTNIKSGTRISTNGNTLTINNGTNRNTGSAWSWNRWSGGNTGTSGTNVTATASSNNQQYEYKFDNWSGVPSTVTEDVTITANFSRSTRKYTLTVRSSNNNYGTVAGAGTYEYGSKVTLTATPKSNYKFTKWNDENTDSIREVTVTNNATYTATFERDASSTPHTHSYTKWKSNNNGTHTGTCSCGETKTENCTYRNNVCTVCGYRKPSTQPTQPSRQQQSSGRSTVSGLFNTIFSWFGW